MAEAVNCLLMEPIYNAWRGGGRAGSRRVAVGLEIDDVAVLDYREGGAGDAGFGEGVSGEFVDCCWRSGERAGLSVRWEKPRKRRESVGMSLREGMVEPPKEVCSFTVWGRGQYIS